MTTAAVDLSVEYHDGQNALFFGTTARFRVITKGRRWGFTRGCAGYVIESMLDGIGPIMWGDTVVVNIERYVERYFMPILKQLPDGLWEWKKQAKQLHINGQVCDFRSADNPENWEGFGYKVIILNEAGIILKNHYLWNNAVRPMLMDYRDSIAIIGGTPKGKGLFYELWKMGEDGEANWKSFKFSSYANPYLSKQAVDELISEMPDGIVQQEIYAEFAELGENVLIPYDLILECMKRVHSPVPSIIEVWGLDVGHGGDLSVLARRNDKNLYQVESRNFADTREVAAWVNLQYSTATVKPVAIFVEVDGIGWGVYEQMKTLDIPVIRDAGVARKSARANALNKRCEMYMNLHEAMKTGLRIVNDRRILRQLANTKYELSKGKIKLIDKEKIKTELGESPDYADACALTYYEPVQDAHAIHALLRKPAAESEKPWSPNDYD